MSTCFSYCLDGGSFSLPVAGPSTAACDRIHAVRTDRRCWSSVSSSSSTLSSSSSLINHVCVVFYLIDGGSFSLPVAGPPTAAGDRIHAVCTDRGGWSSVSGCHAGHLSSTCWLGGRLWKTQVMIKIIKCYHAQLHPAVNNFVHI
jgi:hypothetical protein